MTNPYDRTYWRGKRMDQMTKAALVEAEAIYGAPIAIIQGCYSNAVGASAGTHGGGGAIDAVPTDWARKVHVLRQVGFAAWHRPTLYRGRKRVWGEHIHAVLIGNQRLSYEAARQVTDYRLHRNGLAGHAYDGTWHPSPFVTFRWNSSTPSKKPAPPKEQDMTPDQIATALVTVKVGPENKPQKKQIQEVLADLEQTQDNQGEQIRQILSLLHKIDAKG